MILGVLGVEVGTRNRSKIDQNLKPKMGCLLASIFDGFLWLLGSKLGGKIEPRSLQNGIEKTMKKRRATRWLKSRYKNLELPAAEGVWRPRGVGSAAQGHTLGSPSGHFFRTNFRCLFESILVRSWLDFPSQLASPNPSKPRIN